jgi:hypothetical protein
MQRPERKQGLKNAVRLPPESTVTRRITRVPPTYRSFAAFATLREILCSRQDTESAKKNLNSLHTMPLVPGGGAVFRRSRRLATSFRAWLAAEQFPGRFNVLTKHGFSRRFSANVTFETKPLITRGPLQIVQTAHIAQFTIGICRWNIHNASGPVCRSAL